MPRASRSPGSTFRRATVRASKKLSIGDVRERAAALASRLRGAQGERMLLTLRPGLDFVVAFLACLEAGVVAVPVPVPRQGLGVERVEAILRDSGARYALSTRAAIDTISAQIGAPDLTWIALDADPDAEPRPRLPPRAYGRDDLALLQYSSGSTGAPKGVMISHGNLLHQADLLFDETGARPGDVWAAWLPTYHDMGLISAVVAPLAKDLHSVMLAPEAFILRPSRWLRALGEFGASCCASPNFAYELCARKVGDDELDDVDLSRLRYAVSGAEPVRAATIDRFAQRFARWGFARDAFYPAYGLAEATLLVTGRGADVAVGHYDGDTLAGGCVVVPVDAAHERATALVSSGAPRGGNRVRIVDPDTLAALPERQIGEIWVAGDGVGLGYWGADAERAAAFGARIDGDDDAYLRTGDLGFLHGGELYVRGRLKDLIVIHGANHYAPDIEQTVEASHPSLAPSGGAAFGVDIDDEERLVVVHELERGHATPDDAELAALAASIRHNVTQRHQVSPYAVVLLAGGLPKTSSGKVRRAECRARWLAGAFKPLATLLQTDASAPAPADDDPASRAMRRRLDCELWLTRRIAARLGIGEERLGLDDSLRPLTLDGEATTAVLQEIKAEYGLLVPFTVFMNYPTIRALAELIDESIEPERADAPLHGGRLSAEELANVNDAAPAANDEPIAIIGMACRFPAADGPREFWKNLCEGVDAVDDVPAERWDGDALYDPNPLALGKMNTKRGGFLKNVEMFDNRFFGIVAREAVRMDPAHRLLLELSWEVFEDAGILPPTLSGANVGVYIGISGSDYAQLQFGDDTLSDPYAGVGCALTNSASRISHFHNLRGPALAIDTACSSSLSAVHLGCSALKSGECELVIAGGVNIILAPNVTMSLSKAGMMAPDGRCKTFDKSADGYVRSEGAGLVLLKPLAKALADGDPVYAVIRGSASNQDGRSSAISAPNGEAQQRVVLAACTRAGVQPAQLDYVEAHGTGTALGDPIEVNALGEVLKIGGDDQSRCAIGSVKTNIGHCESAAGTASLIKAALVLSHKQIPPSLNFEEANPLIPFHDYGVYVQRELAPLPARDRARLAGVNSFGIGGTNVHIVLEEFDANAAPAPQAAPRLHTLVLSGKNEKALKANAKALADYLTANVDTVNLTDVAHTLARHRMHFDYRLAAVGESAAEIAAAIESHLLVTYHADVASGFHVPQPEEPIEAAFVFAGQGSQWWAMGRQLYETEPVYRAEVERCDAAMRRHTGWSLIDVLLADEADSLLGETEYAQPAFFALQCGVAAMLASWGVKPRAAVGHSFGEVAAAYVAGALEFEDACRLIAIRARLMQRAKGNGRMVSVEMPRAALAAEIAPYGDALSIAASNSPGTTVVSGTHEALDKLLFDIKQRGVSTVELGLDYAFHSVQMEQSALDLQAALSDLVAREPRIALASTVKGDWTEAGETLGAAYWADNIRNEVRFASAIEAMGRRGIRLFVEIGANPVLSGAMSRTLKGISVKGTVLPSLVRDVDDARALRRCAGALHAAGSRVDFDALAPRGRFVRNLPKYAWDRQRYWLDAPHHESRKRVSTHPLVTIRMPVAQPTWVSRLDITTNPFLAALRARGQTRLGNGLFVELAFEAVAGVAGTGAFGRRELFGLTFGAPLRDVDENNLPALQTNVATEGGRRRVRVLAQADESQGRAESWQPVLDVVALTAGVARRPESPPLATLRARFAQTWGGAEIYRKLGEVGIEYNTAAQVATDVSIADGACLLALRVADMLRADAGRYHLHPLVFEAMEQACRLAAGSGAAHAVLRCVRRLRVFGLAGDAAYAYAVLRDADAGDVARADVWILDAEGEAVAVGEGLCFADAQTEQSDEYSIPTDIDRWRYDVEWVPSALPETAASSEAGRWLVFADGRGAGDALARFLGEQGHECVVARAGDAYRRSGLAAELSPQAGHEDIERLLRETFVEPGIACRGVVHLWSLDATPMHATTAATIADGYAAGVVSAIATVRALSSVDLAKAPRLWLVTAGAQPVEDDGAPLEVAQSLVWGCAKSVVLEHAELRCCRIDLGALASVDEVAALCREVAADALDDQIGLRGDRRYIARLRYQLDPARDGSAVAAASRALRYEFAGEPASLVAIDRRRRGPAAGEVEIRIDVAALPALAVREPRTAQCVGRVLRVGADVEGIDVGRRVICLDAGPLDTHRVVAAASVAVLPDALAPEVAAASARAYLEAVFALRDMAHVAHGDRVLLRLGDDPAQLAAVRVARWLGARVFVAAPASLHASLAALKIAHAFDEADPSAWLDVASLTEGRGVDALVNYAGEFDTSACASLLRAFGRCVDLAAAADPAERGLRAPLPGNASYLAPDVACFLRERPEEARALLDEVATRLADGTFAPVERETVDLDGYADAAYGSGADVVLRFAADAHDGAASGPYRDDATYLITGGLGGLGLYIARRLVRDGAKHLVLVGRRAPGLAALDTIAEISQGGANCVVKSVDMADADAVRQMLADIRATMPPLAGVIHAAGILDNGLIVQMDARQTTSVMPAKVDGAWNLHTHTVDDALDFFVMFSSLASFIGSPGQSNYAAANAFLEALAEHRRRSGQPGLAIAWGPWAEAGMAADVHNLQRLAQHGMGMILPEPGLDLLEDLVAGRVGGAVGALPMNWAAWGKTRGYAGQTPYFAGLVPQQSLHAGGGGKITAASLAGKPVQASLDLLHGAILRAVCQSLMLDADGVDLDVPLTAIGLDSIVSLELKDRIESTIDVVVRTNALVAGKSIRSLAQQFFDDLTANAAAAAAPPAAVAQAPGAELLERLDDLSQAEIEAMLAELSDGAPANAATADEREPRPT
ncbi:type I polyketide synthase [Tahibacter soli]|uniref:SDR family NAD(P)-dependent oxidoreductase n=1 Tax=Tahibacter soli TaxID=2983605 RepID=A0A9X3YRF4_9GAMM|nr:type I polyketide synthase [Tahibacter soli]MDC8016145.1 SDR family NAD(P)-dependent oxidoreductase [Tahibacter soli]